VTERKMFGGVAFMVRGNMCCGVLDDKLMVRVGPVAYEKALKLTHAREMDFTGKAMRGIVYVVPEGTRTARQLRTWVQRGLEFVGTLPAK
jgi:TfoX/Sxy family transcriptional regulator of competence genes